jgi:hypothetical protein
MDCEMVAISQPCAHRRPEQNPEPADPWRRRMQRTAEWLRLLDERRFQSQIAKIEECLQRDAHWNLAAALSTCDRWPRRAGSLPECRG